MTKTQRFVSPQEWYSLEYPRLWEMEVIENIPAFFNPFLGQGALQIFSVKTGEKEKRLEMLKQFPFLSNDKLEEKMTSFLETQEVIPDDGQLNVYKSGETSLIPFEYYVKERFYMVCMFQKKNIFLLALYNCKNKPSEEEAKTIGEIIKSIDII